MFAQYLRSNHPINPILRLQRKAPISSYRPSLCLCSMLLPKDAIWHLFPSHNFAKGQLTPLCKMRSNTWNEWKTHASTYVLSAYPLQCCLSHGTPLCCLRAVWIQFVNSQDELFNCPEAVFPSRFLLLWQKRKCVLCSLIQGLFTTSLLGDSLGSSPVSFSGFKADMFSATFFASGCPFLSELLFGGVWMHGWRIALTLAAKHCWITWEEFSGLKGFPALLSLFQHNGVAQVQAQVNKLVCIFFYLQFSICFK